MKEIAFQYQSSENVFLLCSWLGTYLRFECIQYRGAKAKRRLVTLLFILNVVKQTKEVVGSRQAEEWRLEPNLTP
jgi:hypothetical protein